MKQESGRSMIEMLGVLFIMGIITFGAFKLISGAMDKQKRATVKEEVWQISNGVREFGTQYDDFSIIDNNKIFGVISMKDKNPYGGKYEVSVNPSDSRQFVVAVTGLTKSDCEYFLATAWVDSVEYKMSEHKKGGAVGNCNSESNQNVVRIIYGE